MELLVLNTNLEIIKVLDSFESFIWTDRYCGYGDFEFYAMASLELFDVLREDYYIMASDSDRISIIEDIQIKYIAEKGNHLIITGRSMDSIIDRRIVWSQTVLSGNLQNGIHQLLNENVISPIITDRAIPNFVFEVSTDPIIVALTVDAQFIRTNLYDTIKGLCVSNNIGFKITLSDDNKFVFKLYAGVDHSYDQLTNPYVVFSPKFDNILNTSYLKSKKPLKTVTLVAGEGDGVDQKTTIVGIGVALARREIYTDAKDISQTVDEVWTTDAEYIAQLTQKGLVTLAENTSQEIFDGEVDTTIMFAYGKDFGMGDIVQLASDYGIEGKARVTELIRSQSITGIDICPAFTMIQ
jgi:hypothetical protein